jgi:hypothetical protein
MGYEHAEQGLSAGEPLVLGVHYAPIEEDWKALVGSVPTLGSVCELARQVTEENPDILQRVSATLTCPDGVNLPYASPGYVLGRLVKTSIDSNNDRTIPLERLLNSATSLGEPLAESIVYWLGNHTFRGVEADDHRAAIRLLMQHVSERTGSTLLDYYVGMDEDGQAETYDDEQLDRIEQMMLEYTVPQPYIDRLLKQVLKQAASEPQPVPGQELQGIAGRLARTLRAIGTQGRDMSADTTTQIVEFLERTLPPGVTYIPMNQVASFCWINLDPGKDEVAYPFARRHVVDGPVGKWGHYAVGDDASAYPTGSNQDVDLLRWMEFRAGEQGDDVAVQKVAELLADYNARKKAESDRKKAVGFILHNTRTRRAS